MPAQARIMIRPPSETTPMPNGVHAQSPSSWVGMIHLGMIHLGMIHLGMIHLGMIHGLQCYCRQHGWVDRDLSSDQTSVLVRHQFWSDISFGQTSMRRPVASLCFAAAKIEAAL